MNAAVLLVVANLRLTAVVVVVGRNVASRCVIVVEGDLVVAVLKAVPIVPGLAMTKKSVVPLQLAILNNCIYS